MPLNPLSKIMKLAKAPVKKVETLEGAKKYGAPIGSIIKDDGKGAGSQKRPITIVRLRSLQRQLDIAKQTGNTALLKKVAREYQEGITQLAKTRAATDILDELRGGDIEAKKAVFDSEG